MLVRMLALASHVTSIAVALSRLAAAISSSVALARVDAAARVKAAGTTGLAATAARAI